MWNCAACGHAGNADRNNFCGGCGQPKVAPPPAAPPPPTGGGRPPALPAPSRDPDLLDRLDMIGDGITGIRREVGEVKSKLDEHGRKLDEHGNLIQQQGQRIDQLGTRVDALETRPAVPPPSTPPPGTTKKPWWQRLDEITGLDRLP